ncbi:primosomal protein N' [Pengzhenrongella frigida]|uniref:Probable replication restart protein PriA n=1 Tax=Pengzhenrongella frigida TaxID=1259133 RepID=A0A4V1ZHR0_9MICO|nr:primosomal protein N' [Cellulomonas sp. HLT2-17]
MPVGEQLTLAGLPGPRTARRPRSAVAVEIAERLPVARVCIDLPPAHLDRPFEYLVPAALDDVAQPGTRVKVRFGRQDVDGYLLERVETAEHDGELVPLRKVVSGEAVLTPSVLRLSRAVADRYAGTLADVLRLAIPPRHARVEAEGGPAAAAAAEGSPATAAAAEGGPAVRPSEVRGPTPSGTGWADHRGGGAFLSHLSAGHAPRAVWSALPGGPGSSWADAIAQAVVATSISGRGSLVVVPDARDGDLVAAALESAGVPAWTPGAEGGYARLAADDGPASRYRSFLAVLRGHARVVIGTRAAAFAPVQTLGLVVCWDELDDLHSEPRSPYPHVREVLAIRAEQAGCAALIGGHARSTEAQAMVAAGWAQPLQADRPVVRARTPRVRALTSIELARDGAAGAARLPSEAWRVAREALRTGPVLVQVPRAGYLPVVACERCRTVARCGACHGPLAIGSAAGVPQCTWCGALATTWRCGECGSGALRSVRVGSDRTAEELGRAFPGVPVRVSGAGSPTGVLARVDGRPALVVATPGAEPEADGGYAAALLLDAAVSTARVSLRTGEEAVHRWLTAASLVRPSGAGGVVLLVGDAAPAPTQALVRWDPVGFVERELTERAELALPPAVRVGAVTGTRDAVAVFLARLALPPGADVLGPVVVEDAQAVTAAARQAPGTLDQPVRAIVRAPLAAGGALAAALAASSAVRSARREGGTVRIQLDPREML